MLWVVSSCQELSGDPHYVVIAPKIHLLVCIAPKIICLFAVHITWNTKSTTQAQCAPCLMPASAATVRSENYGGFGATMANSLRCWDRATPKCAVAADSAVPARAVAAMAAARVPGTKKLPPVTVAERTFLTKRPYRQQKKSPMPAPIPQAAAPTAASAPILLVAIDKAVACAPAEKKSPPILPAAPAVAPVPFCSTSPSIQVVFLSRLQGRRGVARAILARSTGFAVRC